jgi:hypothetical protein
MLKHLKFTGDAVNLQQVWRFAVQGGSFVHNNVRSYSVATTVEVIRQLKFELLGNHRYSPDLAPTDYHMFGPLKEALLG